MRQSMRCASCGDGLFKTEVMQPHPSDNNVIGGYWFCKWCHENTDEEELLSRAEGEDGVPRLFSEEEMEAETTEWENPEQKFTE